MDMKFAAGCPITSAALQLVNAAKADGSARGTFNGIRLDAYRDTTPDDVVLAYQTETARQADVYRRSPAGVAAAAMSEVKRADAQAVHDSLLLQLPSLDFCDDAAVLAWLCAFQAPSDIAGVVVAREAVVTEFEHHGFIVGANCDAEFRTDDRDNHFRWLVGQALDGLKNGLSIHGILHKFVTGWRDKFGVIS